jgi:hypothetical protein
MLIPDMHNPMFLLNSCQFSFFINIYHSSCMKRIERRSEQNNNQYVKRLVRITSYTATSGLYAI